jgi:hypothetical protein
MHKTFVKLFVFAATVVAFFALRPAAFAQAGAVSSGMTGTLVDSAGAPIAGATITAIHTPTNTTYTAATTSAGRFSFKGMPVGGPYTVRATPAAKPAVELTDIYTSLGEDTDVILVSKGEEVVKLEEFVVAASTSDLDANATGASSVLTSRRILAQPTVNRSFTDMAKTNPFVSVRGYPQIQALGINNRYNTITLDGAKINDSFGLASSGLFSAFNPFSLDAVEQFSISLTPYDARQSGFAGASINAVSKSGTNEFHGTIYNLFTDTNWQGPDEFGANIHKRSPLKERTYGGTLGGPIIKDKLFFFLNWEKFIQDSAPSLPGYTPDPAFLAAVTAKISSLSGAPDMGRWGGAATARKFDNKRLAKLDWNINQDHRLAVRYSDTKSNQPNYGFFNYTSFSQPVTLTNQPSSFSNLGTGFNSALYNLAIKERVVAAQLFSNWSSDFKTEIDYSNTKQDSVRATPVLFPNIRILNVPGTSNTGASISSNNAFQFGSEMSSQGNELHIKTQTLSGSGDYTWKTFTFSGGADYEKSDFYNLFRQGSYGYFDYWNLSDFQNDKPFGFARAVVSQGTPAADISKFNRTGVFGQVRWDPTARLNVILGIRWDFVGSPIAPPENTTFRSDTGLTNAGTVDGTSTPQPRLSFNYALDAKRLMQIRGGYGIFLGRNPWVWISNSYGNSGVGRFNVSYTTPSATTPNTAAYAGPTLAQYLNGTFSNTDSAYKFDPANPVGVSSLPASAGRAAINMIKPGMKLPTIARGNIAIDRKLPFLDSTFTVEYINTEQLDALFVENLNLKPTSVGADGRQRFAGAPSSATANAAFPNFGNIIRTRNVHAGKSQYVSFQLDHPFRNNWAWSVAYTHGHATEAQSLNSSTANSQWQFNPVFNQGQVEVSRSDYEVKDRIQVTLSHQFVFRKDFITTVSLYYEGRSGLPYSWVYSTDVNGDGLSGNDVLAVPSSPTDSRFDFSGMTTAQQDAYFAFLQTSGLSKFAGGYAPRDSFLTPWQNRLDLRFTQEVPVYSAWGKHIKLEFFLDFLNFGSWLNKHWFNYIESINTSQTNGALTRVLGSATYATDGRIKPTVALNTNGSISLASGSQITVINSDTRWKIQGGVKLKF